MSNLANWVRRDVRVAQARALDLVSKDDDNRPTVHASVYLVRNGCLGLLRLAMNGRVVTLMDLRTLPSPVSNADWNWLIEGWGK